MGLQRRRVHLSWRCRPMQASESSGRCSGCVTPPTIDGSCRSRDGSFRWAGTAAAGCPLAEPSPLRAVQGPSAWLPSMASPFLQHRVNRILKLRQSGQAGRAMQQRSGALTQSHDCTPRATALLRLLLCWRCRGRGGGRRGSGGRAQAAAPPAAGAGGAGAAGRRCRLLGRAAAAAALDHAASGAGRSRRRLLAALGRGGLGWGAGRARRLGGGAARHAGLAGLDGLAVEEGTHGGWAACMASSDLQGSKEEALRLCGLQRLQRAPRPPGPLLLPRAAAPGSGGRPAR